VPADPCKLGVIACNAGVETCNQTTNNAVDGTSCGTAQVCEAGLCIATPMPYEWLTVVAQAATSPVGVPVQLQAQAGRPNEAAEDVSDRVSWTVEPASAGVVIGTIFEPTALGVATIRGNFEGLTDSVQIEVTTAAPKELVVAPVTLELAEGETFQFQARLYLTDGTDILVTNQAQWVSSSPNIATVAAGLVTAVSPGTAQISASHEGLTNNANVVVPLPAITSLTMSPDVNLSLGYGVCVTLVVVAELDNSSTIDATEFVVWSSSNTGALQAGGVAGRFCSIGAGTATITATSGQHSATIQITGHNRADLYRMVDPAPHVFVHRQQYPSVHRSKEDEIHFVHKQQYPSVLRTSERRNHRVYRN
jgi:hypothetical protein